MNNFLKNTMYVLDENSQVWARPHYGSIAYNDGDEIEMRVASIIQQVGDVSVLSTELRQHCTDWASLYHLSGTRSNIIRPFEHILPNSQVLEIGAGCGAITRFLGECGANVLALEGSYRRASIARSRTRDLNNVTVLAEKFDQFQCDQQFDVITLIGVLEYANLFSAGENPAIVMLEQVRTLLKPDGKLIIAIENQLGLKYFANAPEDHLGQAMYGVEGRYQQNQPQTFGRKTLTNMLKQAGFVTSAFLAPFPDYKLPVSILTEKGMDSELFDASAFAWQSVRRDPQLPAYCTFSLELAWPDIFKNGMALDVTNSFLIAASPQDQRISDFDNTLAYHYSTDRVPEYCKETRFESTVHQNIDVICKQLDLSHKDKGGLLDENQLIDFTCPTEVKYSYGKPMSWEFIKIVTRDGWAVDEVGDFLKRYVSVIECLLAESGFILSLSSADVKLPGKFFDLIPQNIIVSTNGTPVVIDTEWSLRNDIKLGWLLFRGMLLLMGGITRFGESSTGVVFSRIGFVQSALASAGFIVTEDDLSDFVELESKIQKQVTGRPVHEFLDWAPNASLPQHNLAHALVERESQIVERESQIAERESQIAVLKHELSILYNSTSWKISKPARVVADELKRSLHVSQGVKLTIQRRGGLKGIAKKAVQLYQREGLQGIKRGVKIITTSGQVTPVLGSDGFDRNDYVEWVRRYDAMTEETRDAMRASIESFSAKPLISVVMPTYNPKTEWLEEAIESVRNQLYPNWELCIADDASTDPAVRPVLERYLKEDPRIKVVFREQNGHISAASNSALQLVTGELMSLLDHDDLLPEHALFWVADAINHHPDARLIYSDEDKIDESGIRHAPYFKCDWNIDLFYSQNMISHLGVYQTDLVRKINGFALGMEGSQDYDLALRYIEQINSESICHIPRVLYHWRVHESSTAQNRGAKPYAELAGEKALNEHFQRKGIKAKGTLLDFSMYRAVYELPSPAPKVSLIIPTRNGLDLIRTCVESILVKTRYPDYEILIIDNGSDDAATLTYFDTLRNNDKVRIIRDDREFNYSSLNNAAVESAQGDVIILVNNDIEVISPDWLTEMASLATQPEVGAVGAMLWYPDDTLQHGGCILGLGGVANHVFKGVHRGEFGYFGRARVLQSFSAVTAACLAIKKSIYHEVGGLNEEDLKVAFNDIDFCLRVREAGYRNVWTPFAELYHHESATRGGEDTPKKQERFAREVSYMQQRWGKQLLNDPAYSPNLTLDNTDFSLAWPPRVKPVLLSSDDSFS